MDSQRKMKYYLSHYYLRDAKPKEKCWNCGEEATMTLVSTYPEAETGYVDEVSLCEECAEEREV